MTVSSDSEGRGPSAAGFPGRTLADWLKVAAFSAIALLLMELVRVPLVPAAPFLTYDFSDVPALLLALALGPWAGLAVVIVKDVLFLMLNLGPWQLLGVPVNALMGIMLSCGTAAVYSRFRENGRKAALLKASLVSSLATVLLMVPVNIAVYYIMVSMLISSSAGFGLSLASYLLAAVIPFNIIKCIITCACASLCFSRLAPKLNIK